jgi:hypothetical protein
VDSVALQPDWLVENRCWNISSVYTDFGHLWIVCAKLILLLRTLCMVVAALVAVTVIVV